MPSFAENQTDEAIAVALEFAECKLTLAEMIDQIFLESHLIQGCQRARLLGGLIEEPDESQIERIARLSAVMRFLENCRDRPDKAIEWLRGRSNG